MSALDADDLPQQHIISIVGDSTQGYNGDQIAAASALLNLPLALAVSRSGAKVYIADSGNHRIRTVDLEYGDIVTVAGNGVGDFSGDGELAINASLKSPAGLALDGEGNLYIADQGNHKIRKVNIEGRISTVAGGSRPGFDGDGGLASQASLKDPMDVVVDGNGDIYIADQGNYRIRKIDGKTGIITTVAGTGERKYNGDERPALEASFDPHGLALDGSGGVLLADKRNHRIRRIDLTASPPVISTLVGTGKRGDKGDGEFALDAQLNKPVWVAVSSVGEVYISDAGNNRIRKVDPRTDIVLTVAGSGKMGYEGDMGPALEAKFSNPFGIALDQNDHIYVADYLNYRIRRINMRKSETIDYRKRGGGKWRWITAGLIPSVATTIYLICCSGGEEDLPGPPKFPR